jgi:hypothetical protein
MAEAGLIWPPSSGGTHRTVLGQVKVLIAGRSPLRLATLSLPTHREVVAAAFWISACGAPHRGTPGSRAFQCCVSAFHAAAIFQTIGRPHRPHNIKESGRPVFHKFLINRPTGNRDITVAISVFTLMFFLSPVICSKYAPESASGTVNCVSHQSGAANRVCALRKKRHV